MTPTNKIVKFNGQVYLVIDEPIVSVSFEYRQSNSKMSVTYAGCKYAEKAFFINYIDGHPDHATESDLYVAVMALSKKILDDKVD